MNYKNVRDIVWKILIKNEITELPIDLEKICKQEGINLFSYKVGKNFIESLGMTDEDLENDAFSISSAIFYNEEKPHQRIRFSIAHEIGHILLHTNRAIKVYNREPSPYDSPIEVEANAFAARLLAPLCVLQFLNLNSAKEIAEICDISYTAAEHRFSRLCEIRKRNKERRSENKHGTFLMSRLERQVLENFKEYIDKNKRD